MQRSYINTHMHTNTPHRQRQRQRQQQERLQKNHNMFRSKRSEKILIKKVLFHSADLQLLCFFFTFAILFFSLSILCIYHSLFCSIPFSPRFDISKKKKIKQSVIFV